MLYENHDFYLRYNCKPEPTFCDQPEIKAEACKELGSLLFKTTRMR